MSSLRIDWCNREAAKYAVEHWHYSKSLPAFGLVTIGAWENEKFIGCVIFSTGANMNIASPFGLKMQQVCELTRVALTTHEAPVSQIVAGAIKMLKKKCPDMLGIVSYADVDHNHHGGIYQAGNWTYLGCTNVGNIGAFIINGKKTHSKSLNDVKNSSCSIAWVRANLDPEATVFYTQGKHKYFMPLTKEMKAQIIPLAKPYPKPYIKPDEDQAS